jgi:hypothetical protein
MFFGIFKSTEEKLEDIKQEIEHLNRLRAKGGSVWIEARRLTTDQINRRISLLEAKRKRLEAKQKKPAQAPV